MKGIEKDNFQTLFKDNIGCQRNIGVVDRSDKVIENTRSILKIYAHILYGVFLLKKNFDGYFTIKKQGDEEMESRSVPSKKYLEFREEH